MCSLLVIILQSLLNTDYASMLPVLNSQQHLKKYAVLQSLLNIDCDDTLYWCLTCGGP